MNANRHSPDTQCQGRDCDNREPLRWFQGWRWIASLAATAVAALLLLLVDCPIEPLSELDPRIPADAWFRLVSIVALSAVIWHLVIHTWSTWFHRQLGLTVHLCDITQFQYFIGPTIVGFFETVIYPVAFLMGHEEFIGAWLLLKVVGNWQGWQMGQHGRSRVHRFLTGTALSLFGGLVTYGAIRYFVIMF